MTISEQQVREIYQNLIGSDSYYFMDEGCLKFSWFDRFNRRYHCVSSTHNKYDKPILIKYWIGSNKDKETNK